MQRVSSLLPQWDRIKTVDGTNNSAHTSAPDSPGVASNGAKWPVPTADTSSTTHGINKNSKNRNSTRGSTSNSTIDNHHRVSSIGNPPRNGRSFAKVFSWTGRTGGHKSLTVSPAIANAIAMPPVPSQIGREAYWPTSLDRECEKAARILKSFCTDGFRDESDPRPTSPTSRASINSLTSPISSRRSADAVSSPTTGPTPPIKKKIPPRIIQDAVGLAIFSCMRSGLWMSGSGGSGILIARKADGTWSPPSGIILHTATVAFVVGVDIYDCVLVINSVAALEMFTRSHVTLGVDIPLTIGPLVTMGLLENDVRPNHELSHTVLTYLKARGRHSPAQLTGSFVTERSNENERFYSEESPGNDTQPINILDILAGNVRKSIPEIIPLFEAIKAAEGRIDFDSAIMDRLSQQPAPGDAEIADTPSVLTPASPSSATFGVPDAADPDPFGIIALEMAGLEIREAGSKHRPVSHQFGYTASPTSPVFATHFGHQSVDAVAMDTGNRSSYLSTRTQATSMTDAYTQTDVGAGTPDTSPSPTHSDDGKETQVVLGKRLISPVPEISLQTLAESVEPATTEPFADGPGFICDSKPPPVPGRTRPFAPVNVSTTDTAALRHSSVDRGTEIDEPLSDATDTATSSHHMDDDEQDEDADDEGEETDDLGNECTDDFDEEDDLEDDDDDMEEEPVIFEVASTTVQPVRVASARVATQVAQVIQAKGALVNIPKRIAPPLPARSPARSSRASKTDYGDLPASSSPLRHSFQSNLTGDSLELSPNDETTRTAVIVQSKSTPAIVVATPVEEESSATTSIYESAANVTAAKKTVKTGTTASPSNVSKTSAAPRIVENSLSSADD
ncbi:hypothetical protein SEPCBS119000_006262 [Sporothrix epigloea]|uniref:Ysc84 actin-binding domain-containing protein n=1 Tax=Sporothrix epigloea TaxID=1892477 RepID=A0ABP0E217_9PEZI